MSSTRLSFLLPADSPTTGNVALTLPAVVQRQRLSLSGGQSNDVRRQASFKLGYATIGINSTRNGGGSELLPARHRKRAHSVSRHRDAPASRRRPPMHTHLCVLLHRRLPLVIHRRIRAHRIGSLLCLATLVQSQTASRENNRRRTHVKASANAGSSLQLRHNDSVGAPGQSS